MLGARVRQLYILSPGAGAGSARQTITGEAREKWAGRSRGALMGSPGEPRFGFPDDSAITASEGCAPRTSGNATCSGHVRNRQYVALAACCGRLEKLCKNFAKTLRDALN